MPARIARYGDGLISSMIVIHLPQRRRRDRRERRDSLVERDGGLAFFFVVFVPFVAATEPCGGEAGSAVVERRPDAGALRFRIPVKAMAVGAPQLGQAG